MKNEDFNMLYGELIAGCWQDESIKLDFIANPYKVLMDRGIEVDEKVTYIVLEAPRMVQYIVLPHTQIMDAVQTLSKVLLERSEKEDMQLIPEGAEIRIVQNTDNIRYLVIPFNPRMLSQTETLVLKVGGWHDVATNVEAVSQAVAVAHAAAYANAAVATNVGAAAAVVVVAGIVLI